MKLYIVMFLGCLFHDVELLRHVDGEVEGISTEDIIKQFFERSVVNEEELILWNQSNQSQLHHCAHNAWFVYCELGAFNHRNTSRYSYSQDIIRATTRAILFRSFVAFMPNIKNHLAVESILILSDTLYNWHPQYMNVGYGENKNKDFEWGSTVLSQKHAVDSISIDQISQSLGPLISVSLLNDDSIQNDRAIMQLLRMVQANGRLKPVNYWHPVLRITISNYQLLTERLVECCYKLENTELATLILDWLEVLQPTFPVENNSNSAVINMECGNHCFANHDLNEYFQILTASEKPIDIRNL